MGLRRPMRQSPVGVRAESRTGREIPHIVVERGRPPRGSRQQAPVPETVGPHPNRRAGKPKVLEL
jgi:hypothetical protein